MTTADKKEIKEILYFAVSLPVVYLLVMWMLSS